MTQPTTYFKEVRIVPGPDAEQRLAVIRASLGEDESPIVELSGGVEGHARDGKEADTCKPCSSFRPLVIPNVTGVATGAGIKPGPLNSAIGTADGPMDGTPLCISGIAIWQRHLFGHGRRCTRCGFVLAGITL